MHYRFFLSNDTLAVVASVVDFLALVQTMGPRALAAAEDQARRETEYHRQGQQARAECMLGIHLGKAIVLAFRALGRIRYCVVNLLKLDGISSIMFCGFIYGSSCITPNGSSRLEEEVTMGGRKAEFAGFMSVGERGKLLRSWRQRTSIVLHFKLF